MMRSEDDDKDRLVRAAQEHVKEQHGKDFTLEEIEERYLVSVDATGEPDSLSCFYGNFIDVGFGEFALGVLLYPLVERIVYVWLFRNVSPESSPTSS